MKLAVLRTIGHNVADSLASGIGLLIGVYEIEDIFAEASRSPEGVITVDFLAGTSTGGAPSPALADVIAAYRDGLADLCRKHGTTIAAFRELTARFSVDALGRRFVVTVEDADGRRAVDQYVGTPGKRIRVRDSQGRVRRA